MALITPDMLTDRRWEVQLPADFNLSSPKLGQPFLYGTGLLSTGQLDQHMTIDHFESDRAVAPQTSDRIPHSRETYQVYFKESNAQLGVGMCQTYTTLDDLTAYLGTTWVSESGVAAAHVVATVIRAYDYVTNSNDYCAQLQDQPYGNTFITRVEYGAKLKVRCGTLWNVSTCTRPDNWLQNTIKSLATLYQP